MLPNLFKGFVNLFYPNACAACGNDLVRGEEALCLICLYKLPRTRFWNEPNNAVAQTFWGRVTIENACAYFFFSKGSSYQQLLHKLKYDGHKSIGVALGKQLGAVLAQSELYSHIDYVVPVPLHPRKLRIRGYNQAEVIAQGVCEAYNAKLLTNVLVRTEFTQTQTRKTREERARNVAQAFAVSAPAKLSQKHILLIDDVITTGATLEACANKLLTAADCKVSLAALAYAAG
ncbi:MAG: ComF family protein [Bacteroidales bacterium]|jgi:ComF family protein|nr:ComF family protein [Bacteroidales bacterium]